MIIQFLKETRAAATIEFLVVFPIFLSIWVGVTEITNMQAVNIKSSNRAAAIGIIASTYHSGDRRDTHPISGERYANRATFRQIHALTDKLSGGFGTTGNSGAVIMGINRCGAGGLQRVFRVKQGRVSSNFASFISNTDLGEDEGMYYIAVRQEYDSIMGDGVVRDILSVIVPRFYTTEYIIKPRTGGLLRDFSGNTRC